MWVPRRLTTLWAPTVSYRDIFIYFLFINTKIYRNVYTRRILVGKPKGNRPLGRPRRRSLDNVKIDIGEIEWDGIEWIDLAQNMDQWRALVNTVMNHRIP
jgi:hypothetical protein